MATKTTVQLVDDVDGGEAEETVEFGLDGVNYEIDLHGANAESLREALGPWMDKGRRTGGRIRRAVTVTPKATVRAAPKAPNGSSPSGDLTKDERTALRAWATEAGYQIAVRGRISGDIRRAWEEVGRPGIE